MTAFESKVEHILNERLSAKSKTNDIRLMLISNSLLDYESFRQMEPKHVYTIKYDIIGVPTKLQDLQAVRVANTINIFHPMKLIVMII